MFNLKLYFGENIFRSFFLINGLLGLCISDVLIKSICV